MLQALALAALLSPAPDTLPATEAMPPHEILIDGRVHNGSPASDFAAALGAPDSTVTYFNEVLGDTGTYHHYGRLTLVSYDGGASVALDALRFDTVATDTAAHFLRFGARDFRAGTTFDEVAAVFPLSAAAAWAPAPTPYAYGGRATEIISVGLSRERFTDVRYYFVFVGGLLRGVYYVETC